MLPDLPPLAPALVRDRRRVERHAGALRAIVAWSLLAQAGNALRRRFRGGATGRIAAIRPDASPLREA